MSIKNKCAVSCPGCNTKMNFIKYDSVTATLNPEIKRQLLSGEFGKTICPVCGQVSYIVYGFLFHDPKGRYMISLKYDYSDACPMVSTPRNYKLRHTEELPELVEKIHIFDAQLDDVIIEIVKIMLNSMREKNDKYLFVKYEGDFLYFETSESVIRIDAILYDMAEEYYHGIGVKTDNNVFLRVNQDYAKHVWSFGGGGTVNAKQAGC